ncbi:hypothetical protein PV326_003816, partial [Microctonus aethiopoides]
YIVLSKGSKQNDQEGNSWYVKARYNGGRKGDEGHMKKTSRMTTVARRSTTHPLDNPQNSIIFCCDFAATTSDFHPVWQAGASLLRRNEDEIWLTCPGDYQED